MLSLEQVAERLGLHVRTVRGYVRDGRLKAVRIGKQYRVAEDDLAEFTGEPSGPVSIEVTSVVQVDHLSRKGADRLGVLLMSGVETVRVQTVHDPERSRLRIVLFGPAEEVADVLRLIAVVRGEL
ncbi:helix-turn-helix domain-containing protein [Actinokineospora pegani]|uniref:helix-turn-helix domain-containing protein n=1 Tax=Actinokineospora pegani TaxID=2654637 RepID=UPI0012EA0BE7|nr:helix-turn-helix domain-containing protein [Actinokineospora pegani]